MPTISNVNPQVQVASLYDLTGKSKQALVKCKKALKGLSVAEIETLVYALIKEVKEATIVS